MLVKSILIVDDIVDNSDLLKAVLEIENYQIDVASSGAIALEKIAANPPDLVLLDVMMPGMNGYEVTQQIRHTLKLSMPILLVTGNDQPDRTALNLNAEDFIRKPIDFDKLINRIKTVLG